MGKLKSLLFWNDPPVEHNQIVRYDATTRKWWPVDLPGGTGAVDSVNGQTGDVSLAATDVGAVASVVAGDNVSVDNTDPANPVVSATSGASGLVHTAVPIVFDTVNLMPPAWPITAVNDGTQTFGIADDHTALLPPGSLFQVTGSTGNDSTYTVASSSFAAGTTSVVTVESVPDATVDGTLSNVSTLGFDIYTPSVDDVLVDVWLELTTAWSALARFDVGTFVAATFGLFGDSSGVIRVDVNHTDIEDDGTGLLINRTAPSLAAGAATTLSRQVPSKFTATNPLKAVISSTGTTEGLPVAVTAGAGIVHILTITA